MKILNSRCWKVTWALMTLYYFSQHAWCSAIMLKIHLWRRNRTKMIKPLNVSKIFCCGWFADFILPSPSFVIPFISLAFFLITVASPCFCKERGRNQKGKEATALTVPEIRNPSHQAPTQRISLKSISNVSGGEKNQNDTFSNWKAFCRYLFLIIVTVLDHVPWMTFDLPVSPVDQVLNVDLDTSAVATGVYAVS